MPMVLRTIKAVRSQGLIHQRNSYFTPVHTEHSTIIIPPLLYVNSITPSLIAAASAAPADLCY